MFKNKKILVIDDDIKFKLLLENYLTENNFYVKSVINFNQMKKILLREFFDLIILDLILPDEDGLSICKKLRNKNNYIPIIIVTAKNDDIDKILGLEIGADDYICKPFNNRELLARIKSLLRRKYYYFSEFILNSSIIKFGNCKLNLNTREMFKNNKKIFLTSSEFSVLKVLVNYSREPLSREKLMFLAFNKKYNAVERSIDIQVSKLRRLIEIDFMNPRYIQTVWGLGYVFIPDDI